LSVDPTQMAAHLYLADEFDRQQKPEAAIPHYTVYLESIAKRGGKPDANLVLPVMIKLAQCTLRANHPDQALQLYDLGRRIASQTGHPRIESVASVNEANLQSKAGRTGDA